MVSSEIPDLPLTYPLKFKFPLAKNLINPPPALEIMYPLEFKFLIFFIVSKSHKYNNACF